MFVSQKSPFLLLVKWFIENLGLRVLVFQGKQTLGTEGEHNHDCSNSLVIRQLACMSFSTEYMRRCGLRATCWALRGDFIHPHHSVPGTRAAARRGARWSPQSCVSQRKSWRLEDILNTRITIYRILKYLQMLGHCFLRYSEGIKRPSWWVRVLRWWRPYIFLVVSTFTFAKTKQNKTSQRSPTAKEKLLVHPVTLLCLQTQRAPQRQGINMKALKNLASLWRKVKYKSESGQDKPLLRLLMALSKLL